MINKRQFFALGTSLALILLMQIFIPFEGYYSLMKEVLIQKEANISSSIWLAISTLVVYLWITIIILFGKIGLKPNNIKKQVRDVLVSAKTCAFLCGVIFLITAIIGIAMIEWELLVFNLLSKTLAFILILYSIMSISMKLFSKYLVTNYLA